MSNVYLEKAIELLGGQTALAKACGNGLKQQHIWNWLNRDQKIPAQHVAAIEQATDGLVLKEQLRPDVYANKAGTDEFNGESAPDTP